VVPGAFDALTARLIQEAGFGAVYMTGAGYANASFALPDIGLVSSSEIATHVGRVADAVDIPVIVDADTGYGGVLRVRRTVAELQRMGAAGIQLEDQVLDKRCGHFEGQTLIGVDEMVEKIRAARDAREDPDLVLIARTDARSVEGFDAAVDRARRYVAAGADAIFVEAPRTREEVLVLPSLIEAPLVANMVEGGKTPMIEADDLSDAGYAMVLYANTALRASIAAVREAMTTLRREGSTTSLLPTIASWQDRQALVRLADYQALEHSFTTPAPTAQDGGRRQLPAPQTAQPPAGDNRPTDQTGESR
jgi:2-methylisocitrate lyase-like PEP mutase family enzyme